MRLIDADALCKTLERRIEFRNKCLKENPPQDFIANNIMAENDCDRELIDLIYDAPTVEADVVYEMPTLATHPVSTERHGHWEYNPKDAFEVMFELPKCSVCGHESSDALNYCPSCGAKMDEVEE